MIEGATRIQRLLVALLPWPFVVALAGAVSLLLLPRATDNPLIFVATLLASLALASFGAAAVAHSVATVRRRLTLDAD